MTGRVSKELLIDATAISGDPLAIFSDSEEGTVAMQENAEERAALILVPLIHAQLLCP